jgi:hypothetical protein
MTEAEATAQQLPQPAWSRMSNKDKQPAPHWRRESKNAGMSDAAAVTGAAFGTGDEACRGTPPNPNAGLSDEVDSTDEAEDISYKTKKVDGKNKQQS